jgi:hypothetical protein
MKNNIETRTALLEQSIGYISESLQRIETKIDKGFSEVDARLNFMNTRMNSLDRQLWANFIWTLSAIFGLTGTAFGIMAKGFGWL